MAGSSSYTSTSCPYSLASGAATCTASKEGCLTVCFTNFLGNGLIFLCGTVGVVSTLAGQSTSSYPINGLASQSSFSNPVALARDSSGSIFVADYGNAVIRKISSELSATGIFVIGLVNFRVVCEPTV